MAATDVPEPMAKLFAQIDANKKHYIDNLAKAVAIKSVSAWPETRDEITTMMTWMGEELKGLGASIEYVDIGSQTLPDGQVQTKIHKKVKMQMKELVLNTNTGAQVAPCPDG